MPSLAGYWTAPWRLSPCNTATDSFNRCSQRCLHSHSYNWLLGVGLTLVPAIAVHEPEHLVGGLGQGLQCVLFIVGPLKVERAPDIDALRVLLNRNFEMAGSGRPVSRLMSTTSCAA